MSNFILRKTHRLQAVGGLTKSGKVAPPAPNVTALAHGRKLRPKAQAPYWTCPILYRPARKEKAMFELYVFSVLVTLAIAAGLGAR